MLLGLSSNVSTAVAQVSVHVSDLPGERLRIVRPAERITALLAADDGWLWVGTDIGLCQYDGRVCTFNDRALESQEVNAVINGSTGVRAGGGFPSRVWQAGSDGKLATSASAAVQSLCVTADDTLWVATANGVERRSQGVTTVIIEGLPDANAQALMAADDGGVWVGSAKGLGRIDATGNATTLWKGDAIHALQAGPRQSIYLATEHEGLMIFDQRTNTVAKAPGWQFDPTVLALHKDKLGTLWIGTGNGLVRAEIDVAKPEFVHVLKGYQLPAVRVLAVADDHEGNLWLGTDGGGLVQIPPRPAVRVLPASLLGKESIVFTVATVGGDVWFNLGTRLAKLSGTELRVITPPDALKAFAMRSMVPAQGQELWIAGEEVYSVSGETITRQAMPALPQNHSFRSLMRANDGSLWMGLAPSGVAHLQNGALTFVSGKQLGCDAIVSAMVQDVQGAVFAATDGDGLCKLLPGESKGTSKLAAGAHFMSLTLSVNGGMWLGSRSEGIAFVKDQKVHWLGKQQGVPEQAVGEILSDSRGFLWVSTRKGVLRVAEAELTDVALGRRPTVNSVLLSMQDGMPSNDCIWGWPHTSVIDEQGQLLVTTLKGIAIIDTKRDLSFPKLSSPKVQSLLINGEDQILSSTLVQTKAGRGSAQIAYGVAAFAARSRVQFRYKLMGIDNDWVVTHEPTLASYANLASGDYKFTVEALYQGDERSRVSTSLNFRLMPAFYATAWFRLICVLAFAAAGYAAWRLRRDRKRVAAEARAQERQRIARDIHDTLEQTFVATKLQLDAAFLSVTNPEIVTPLLTRARGLLAQAMVEMRVAILALRQTGADVADLPAAVGLAATQAAKGHAIDLKVSSSGHPCPLSPDVTAHLLHVLTGAITNALKHAAPSAITVTTEFEPHRVTLRVCDNGKGIDLPNVASAMERGHYGIRGMHERALAVGGSLTIAANAAGGTEVCLQIPTTRRSKTTRATS